MANKTEALSGTALLDRVKDLNGLSGDEKAIECGYYTTTKDGAKRVSKMKFMNALIEAEGIELDGKSSSGNGRGGRSASFKISVQSNGNLLIGSTYTEKMELTPGDEFEITLGRKHIHLKQITDAADD